MLLHHVTVTNQPTNQVFKLMKNVKNLCEAFPSAQIGHGKGMGYKIILFRMHLDYLKDDDIVLFTDAHDIKVTGTENEILARYWDFGSEIVFSAEYNCWPVKSNETRYLTHNTPGVPYKYLNSGGFIGRVSSIKKLIDENFHNVSGATDDQTYYTNLYINHQHDREFIQLDTCATLFQCLHLAVEDIDHVTLENKVTGTRPLIWHSNGYLHRFFMETLCGLEYVEQIKLEIDQQLISPRKNVIAFVTQSGISEENSKYFFKVYEGPESLDVCTVEEAQAKLHEKYPTHWIAMFSPDFEFPHKFDYLIYGRIMDTRKVYTFLTQMMTFEHFQMYYDKTKYSIDEFMRAGQIEVLAQLK